MLIISVAYFIYQKLMQAEGERGFFASNYEELTLIISLITIFYLYKTYKSTLVQNEQMNCDSSLQKIDEQINAFTYLDKQGSQAINALDVTREKGINNHYYHQVILIISLFESYFFQLESSRILPDELIETKKIQAYTLFYSKVLWPFYDAICGTYHHFFYPQVEQKLHDDFGFTIVRFTNLSLDCLGYLSQRGHIEIEGAYKKEVIGILTAIAEGHGTGRRKRSDPSQ